MPIYFIRHGQSEFNAVHNDGDDDPLIFDAPLTDKGRGQAEEARALVADLGIRQVIASPLTRALQTALSIFDSVAPIKVSADAREQLLHSCDVGRPPHELQQDFPGLSFAHLQNVWWHQGPENDAGVTAEPENVFRRRVDAFDRSLTGITDRPVAIVGHGNLFRALIGRMMENCEIHLYQPGKSPMD
ncbi:MAG: histidine phosphatase family protein [Proteobacteria bacterium]|nr:histidine phosphatase family protein [Pseudomonadota bacterium]